ncbi:hypothetical protein J6S37_00300 [Candidatus Saccharibacteria bacterium]|nr:hypothetical protein [Candidatus Saccharibacteria bacterium]
MKDRGHSINKSLVCILTVLVVVIVGLVVAIFVVMNMGSGGIGFGKTGESIESANDLILVKIDDEDSTYTIDDAYIDYGNGIQDAEGENKVRIAIHFAELMADREESVYPAIELLESVRDYVGRETGMDYYNRMIDYSDRLGDTDAINKYKSERRQFIIDNDIEIYNLEMKELMEVSE